MTQANRDEHCRICGSYELNKAYYDLYNDNQLVLYYLIGQNDSLDELIRPCECRGEFAHAHKICLARWIETTRHRFCDICRFEYNVTFIQKSFFDWFYETRQIKSFLKVLCGALLIYYLCALGILVTQERGSTTILDYVVIISSYTWLVICSLSLLTYGYYSSTEFKTWQKSHTRVVIKKNDNPQLDSEPKPKDVLKSSGYKP